VAVTDNGDVLYSIFNALRMLHAVVLGQEVQSLILAKILVCLGISQRKLPSKRTDNAHQIFYHVCLFFRHSLISFCLAKVRFSFDLMLVWGKKL
jgi:hypothetical protein